MNESKFPAGWDAERVKRLIDYYEGLSEDKQVAEDEATAAERPGQAVITVPEELLPAIRRLLAAQTERLTRHCSGSAARATEFHRSAACDCKVVRLSNQEAPIPTGQADAPAHSDRYVADPCRNRGGCRMSGEGPR